MRHIFFFFFFLSSSTLIFAQTDSTVSDSEISRADKNAQDKINARLKELRESKGLSPRTLNDSETDSVPEFSQNNSGLFKNMDSSMTRSFGYFFDGNNGKMWNGRDTVHGQNKGDMRDKLSKPAPDFEKLFGGIMPLDGMKNFGDMDSMIQRSFGFLFDGNKMMPFGAAGDSIQMNQLNKLFGNMDLGKLMEGDMFKNFGDLNMDKMPRVAPEDNSKSKKNFKKKDKYNTESL